MGNFFTHNETVPSFLLNSESISGLHYPLQVSLSNHICHKVIRFVIISDTHTRHRNITLPLGDVLIHCGDWSNYSTSQQDYIDFNNWLGEQPHKHKIIVPGNHETGLPTDPARVKMLFSNAVCLFDQSYEIEGIKLYGAPGIPARCFFYRANYMQYSRPKVKWSCIPSDTDILITHTPPKYLMDYGQHRLGFWREGDIELLYQVLKIRPKMHCFGHNHDEPGVIRVLYSENVSSCPGETTLFVNAAMARAIIPPVVIDFVT